MKKTQFAGLCAATLAAGTLVLSACDSSGSSTTAAPAGGSSMSMTSTMSMSQPIGASRGGTFAGMNGKNVSGKVTVNGDSVVLTGFSSDEGPDLHLYLTNGTDEAAVGAGKHIGPVRYDAASQTFMVTGVDTAMYRDVVIHCDKAKAVFGAASLS